MKASKLFLILFLLAVNIFAQNIGDWRIYADLSDVRGAVTVDQTIWSATSGGIYKTGLVDTSFTLFFQSRWTQQPVLPLYLQ